MQSGTAQCTRHASSAKRFTNISLCTACSTCVQRKTLHRVEHGSSATRYFLLNMCRAQSALFFYQSNGGSRFFNANHCVATRTVKTTYLFDHRNYSSVTHNVVAIVKPGCTWCRKPHKHDKIKWCMDVNMSVPPYLSRNI
jgi:hypothetical protein